MDFQKYLKYKTKYLLQKTLLQKGGNNRFKILVQRVGLPTEGTFDIVLWDNQAPEHLKCVVPSSPRDGSIVWTQFNASKTLPTVENLVYPQLNFLNNMRLSPDLPMMMEVVSYVEKFKSFHLEMMKRAFQQTWQNRKFIREDSLKPTTNQLFYDDKLLENITFTTKLEIPS